MIFKGIYCIKLNLSFFRKIEQDFFCKYCGTKLNKISFENMNEKNHRFCFYQFLQSVKFQQLSVFFKNSQKLSVWIISVYFFKYKKYQFMVISLAFWWIFISLKLINISFAIFSRKVISFYFISLSKKYQFDVISLDDFWIFISCSYQLTDKKWANW